MKKLLLLALLLGGCQRNYEWCKHGVIYYVFNDRAVSVAYTPEGKIKTCKEGE